MTTFDIDGISYDIIDNSPGSGYSKSDIEAVLTNLHKTDAYLNGFSELDPEDKIITIHIDYPGVDTGISTSNLDINIKTSDFEDGLPVPDADWTPMENTLDFALAHEIGHYIDAKKNGLTVFNNMAQAEGEAIAFENGIRGELELPLRASDGHEEISGWKFKVWQNYVHYRGVPMQDFDLGGGTNELPDDIYDNGPPAEIPENYYPPLPEHKPEFINDIDEKLDDAEAKGDPLVLDLDGDGIELVSLANIPVYWDIDQDGFSEASGWVAADDGFLAIDTNEDGVIDGQSELFGTLDTDGFQILAQYDINGDEVIDDQDAVFEDLIVWQDDNQNGYSEEGELYTLNDLDILSIDPDATGVSQIVEGHSITHASTYTYDTGAGTATRDIKAVAFQYDNANTIYSQEVAINEDMYELPMLRGYGNVADLYTAMSLDNDDLNPDSLISLVTDLSELTFAQLFTGGSTTLDLITEIMYRWAGVDDVLPNSRGQNIDARKLEFLEELLGQEYAHHAGPNPGPVPAIDLEEGFHIVQSHIYANLLTQAAGGELFTGDFYYDIAGDSIEGITGIDSTKLAALESEATGLASTAARETFWSNVIRMVEYSVGTANLSGTDQTALDDAITDSDASLDLAGIVGALAFAPPETTTTNGTAGGDTLNGGTGNDTINGLADDDTLTGGAGSDILSGGTDEDSLTGGTGSDWLQGGSGNDLYYWNAGDGHDWILEAGSGTGHDNDRIVFGAGFDSGDLTFSRLNYSTILIEIDNGTDTGSITIENQINYVTGGGHVEWIDFAADTSIDLDALNFTLTGTDAADTLYGANQGSAGNDTIYGGAGNDLIHSFAPNQVELTQENWVYGEDGNDTLKGSTSIDHLYGGAGDDYLTASGGDDELAGGAGDDELYGGGGADVFTYVSGHDEVNGDINDEIHLDAAWNSQTPDYFRIANDLQIFFDADNTITVKGHFSTAQVPDMIYADTTSVDLTSVTAVSQGTSGNDNLSGTANADVLYGFGGNDTLTGHNGNDTLEGGTGDDYFNAGYGDDYLAGGAGDDTMLGGGDDDHYYYVSGHDTVTDTNHADILELAEGWAWEDLSIGRHVANLNNLVISINEANSITIQNMFYSAGPVETLRLNDGTGDVNLMALDYATHGDSGNNSMSGIGHTGFSGGAVDDTMYGYDGTDTLDGASGDDSLYGGNGNDTLYGKTGNDYLEGGAGDDFMDGAHNDDHYLYESGHDTVMDGWGGADIVELAEGWEWGDLTFRRHVADLTDLVIEIDGSNSIKINQYFLNPTSAMETLRLQDGTGDVTLTTRQYETHGDANNNNLSAIVYNASTDDIQYGWGGNDTLNGGAGDDTLYGGDGNDTLYGGADNDTYAYSAGLDTFQEQSGADTLLMTGGLTINDVTVATHSTYHAKIIVNAGTDEVTLNWQNYSSAYEVETLAFDDGFTADLTSYSSWINGTSGNDVKAGNANDNVIIGFAGDDDITGGDGADHAHGGDGADDIYGEGGADLLYGGIGNDVLYGGDGLDTMAGGAGADTFTLEAASAFNNVDVIRDFSTGDSDVLDIADILDGYYNSGTDAITDFVQITDNGTDSTLAVDQNGGADNFVSVATLLGVTGLTDEAALESSGTLLAA